MENVTLYQLLLKETAEINELTETTVQYDSFLQFSEFNEICSNVMLRGNRILSRHSFNDEIEGLGAECKKCWGFYLKQRNNSHKRMDIVYGVKYEHAFISFLNNIGIKSEKADKKNKSLPDNLILNGKDEPCAFYELKYHNAPFVMRFKSTPGRECYEGSVTLDYEKVKRQITLTRENTDLPVFYVHWIDFPCIKGVYFMTLEETQAIMEAGVEFDRKERSGDFIKGKKVGYTSKFYPSLKTMRDFVSLIKEFNDAAKS